MLVPMQCTSLSEEALEEDGYEEDEDREKLRKPPQMVSRQVRTACASPDVAHYLSSYALPHTSHWQGEMLDPRLEQTCVWCLVHISSYCGRNTRDHLRVGCRVNFPLPTPGIRKVQDSKAEACKSAVLPCKV